MELAGCNFKHCIQFSEEFGYTQFFVFYLHAFDAQAYDVDGGERNISASDGCFRSETVFEYTCAASHGCHFVLITLRIVCFPFFTLVECSVQVQEVREETACGYFASKLVKIIVAVFRQITYATFLFPYLDREDGSLAIAYALIGAFQ